MKKTVLFTSLLATTLVLSTVTFAGSHSIQQANASEELSLNSAAELPFTIKVSYDLLTINWGSVNLLKLEEKTNALNVPHDDLVAMVETMLNTHFIKFIKGYTKNVALAAILTLVTGMEFKNFKLETKDGFLLTSIAVNLDK